MRRGLIRCNSGHYFRGPTCPMDGWGNADITALWHEISRLESANELSFGLLRDGSGSYKAGSDLLCRVIVWECHDEMASFDALVPHGYVIGQQWVPLEQAPVSFK